MRITLLGTGDAGGVPLHGCGCRACLAAAERGIKRRPACALLESGGERVLLDAGLCDLTERFAPGALSAILLTHFHADHVLGLFHLRWGLGAAIPVYAPPDAEGCADLYKNPGLLDFHPVVAFHPIVMREASFTPLPLAHSKPTFGYAIEGTAGRRFAYLTDTCGLPRQTEDFLMAFQPSVVALDCTHPNEAEGPLNHNRLADALRIAGALKPDKVWLTHLSHRMDAWLLENGGALPGNVAAARDGQVLQERPGL
jgi:phosphoribosyl 1,2-cyclic phosphate phosphodiesterase